MKLKILLLFLIVHIANAFQAHITVSNSVLDFGDSTNLICLPSNAEYTWSKDGEEIHKKQFYKISKAKISDAGNYTCVVTVNGESSTYTTNIKVTKLPKFVNIESIQNPVLGLDARIRAPFSAPSNAVVIWVSENGQIIPNERYSFEDNNSTLVIRNFEKRDNGEYLVAIETPEHTTSTQIVVTGQDIPKIDKFVPTNIRLVEGQHAPILCHASGSSNIKFTWFEDDSEVIVDGVNIKVDTYGPISRLSVSLNKSKPLSNYMCMVSNKAGSENSTTALVILVDEPSLPGSTECKLFNLPTRGKCILDYSTISINKYPTHFNVSYAPANGSKSVDYSLADFKDMNVMFDGLVPNSEYVVKFQALNEIGKSEWSEEFELETTDAWVPDPVSDVHVNCYNECVIHWTPGYDNGASIIKYVIALNETTDDKITEWSEESVNASIEVSHLRQNTKYNVSVVAVNSVGLSTPTATVFTTRDISTVSGTSYATIILCVIILFIAIAFVGDIILYKFKKVSVLRCTVCKSKEIKGDVTNDTVPEQENLLANKSNNVVSGQNSV